MSSSELTNNSDDRAAAPLDILRQFARRREARPPAEQCELCSDVIPSTHRHLLDLSKNTLVCVCRPCSILFSDPGAGGGRYRLVPSRCLLLQDFQMSDEQWDDLMIPVNMVYIFYSSAGGEHTSGGAGASTPEKKSRRVMAFYPSPAGPMESLLSLEGWDELVGSNPILNELEPDVEALLINRVQNRGGNSYREHFIVPIDACYELVGLIRLKWKGLSGGEEVWKAIAEFFADLRSKATIVGEAPASTGQKNPTPVRGETDAGSKF